MKTIKGCIFLFTILITSSSFGQKFRTDGYWAGIISIKDDYEDEGFGLILYVEDGKAREVKWDTEEDNFFFVKHDTEVHTKLRNNMIFTWMDQGGAWSETQSFMLSSVSDEMMGVLWLRQVTNEAEAGDNLEWNVVREGYLSRYELDELATIMRD